MRNMKMALAVLAVLAMASTTFGDYAYDFGGIHVESIYQGPAAGNPDYESWLIRTSGAIAFQDITIDAPVVQVSQVNFGTVTPTGYYDSIPDAAPADFRELDTHFLFSATAGEDALFYAGGVTEGNDATLAAILSVSAPPWTAGMGAFNSTLAFSMLGTEGLAGLDLMQVVIPAGDMKTLSGVGIDYLQGEAFRTIEGVQIGAIPEPGTIVLLIAGALCLVVARFRK